MSNEYNEQISSGYVQGYTKALLDVLNWFKSHSDALKRYKAYKQKDIEGILQAMLNDRQTFMKYGENVIIIQYGNDNRKQYKIYKLKAED